MSFSDKVQFIKVEPANVGQRLDNFLMRQLKGMPRSRVYRLIRKGEVRVNKKRAKPENRLEKGDTVRIPPYSGPAEASIPKPSPGLGQLLLDSILKETDQYLVLNKPAGLSVHGGSGIRLGLIEALRQLHPAGADLELVHRLDRDTSGCLVVSKNSIALKALQEQLKAKTVDKHYLALVRGNWPETLVEVDAPLARQEAANGERIVRVDPEGKASRTRFKVLKHFESASLVEAMPETGRTHQIRVHCQQAGHPIIGDDKYLHSRQQQALPAPLAAHKDLCLHAAKISFQDPDRQQRVTVEAKLAGSFHQLLQRLQ
jgi:23S rRNA pseudouridine955/2504/2580 synthase